jgi:hypothetical protein
MVDLTTGTVIEIHGGHTSSIDTSKTAATATAIVQAIDSLGIIVPILVFVLIPRVGTLGGKGEAGRTGDAGWPPTNIHPHQSFYSHMTHSGSEKGKGKAITSPSRYVTSPSTARHPTWATERTLRNTSRRTDGRRRCNWNIHILKHVLLRLRLHLLLHLLLLLLLLLLLHLLHPALILINFNSPLV